MAYDERLAQRIRKRLEADPAIEERKMFGGIAFLRNGLMFVGVSGETLMVRVGSDAHGDSLARPHVREMDFTGTPMRGYVFVDAEGIRTEAQLRFWVKRSLDFVATLPRKRPKKK